VRQANVNKEPSDSMRDQILSMQWAGDWDGEGAKPITASVCKAAIRFGEEIRRESLPLPDSIAPSTQGAIGFTWRTRSDQFNVQVSSSRKDGCLVRRAGSSGRRSRQCSIPEALQELTSFLAPE
jgi:hypothetical protein